MKLICRVLNIRKHKSVVFIDIYSSNEKKEQIMLERGVFEKKPLKNGDCFAVSGEMGKNDRGADIFKVKKFLWINPCQSFETNRNLPAETKGYERYAQVNARAAGKQVNVYKLKRDLMRKLAEILEKDGFECAQCHVLEKERTGSAIPPFVTKGRFSDEEIYLRITPENQLKQISAILLKSVYTIGSVFFNKNPDAKHQPEMSTLEFVSLGYTKQKLLKFMVRVSQIMNGLCKKYGFETDHPSIPEVIDYDDLDKLGILYQRRIPEFKNTLLINAPVANPLVKADAAGKRTEIKWYLNGSLTAHGYQDETDYRAICAGLEQQRRDNNLTNINDMPYVEWGLPRSVSFGLGIDALVCRYLNLEHMTLAQNPLGINYVMQSKDEGRNVSLNKIITEHIKKQR